MSAFQVEGVTVSIVSHNQVQMLNHLLADLIHCKYITKVIVTHNLPEPQAFFPTDYDTSKVVILENDYPLGFGRNHNRAFLQCTTKYFAILNPDLRLPSDPFPNLLNGLESGNVGAIAPVVSDGSGGIEDNARRFPTPISLLTRCLRLDTPPKIPASSRSLIDSDWVAGMFIIMRSELFSRIGGFDERFFLYCEDVDLCLRLRRLNYKIVLEPSTSVIHYAQRLSRRQLKYFVIHLLSYLRLFRNYPNLLWTRKKP